METLQLINRIIAIAFFLCYAYQFFYLLIPWLKRDKPHAPEQLHRFAILICARNEEAVIADLLDSIRSQTYDSTLLTTFVLADNCTDRTAVVARQHGAVVYRRQDSQHIGKGYALQALSEHIAQDYPEGFDGYLVFDADNILAPDYIEQMNRSFSDGHDILTGYRNSKNFGDNWISAGHALWFLRNSRYLNHPRHLLGTSCCVNGTGFLFSRRVWEHMGPWPFHTLTEDTEFSVAQITQGRRIAFCPDAVLYDEQPTSFAQSWRQRSRWAQGYLQVFRRYGGKLLRGIGKGSWACFDMTVSIMPAFFLSVASIFTSLILTVWSAARCGSVLMAVQSIGSMLLGAYLTLFVTGAVAIVSEWRHIRTTTLKKLLYTLTFPLFMFTYLPIAITSLFVKAEWRPIRHQVCAAQLDRRCKEEALPF